MAGLPQGPQGSAFTWARLNSDRHRARRKCCGGNDPKVSRPAQLEGWILELPREQFGCKGRCVWGNYVSDKILSPQNRQTSLPGLGSFGAGACRRLRVCGSIIQRRINSGQPLLLSTTLPPAGWPRRGGHLGATDRGQTRSTHTWLYIRCTGTRPQISSQGVVSEEQCGANSAKGGLPSGNAGSPFPAPRRPGARIRPRPELEIPLPKTGRRCHIARGLRRGHCEKSRR